eukprot:7261456-Alexandrium_andersonii.AAC.1
MFRSREHQSAQEGLPTGRYGRRAPSSRWTRSRSSGLLKPHKPPSGLGRMSNAPAGKTPGLGLRAAAAVPRGGSNTSATVARTSPGVAPPQRALWQ